jgi:dihydropteroate synthase
MHLIEPLGLLGGAAAREAVAAGAALPLRGGAFTLARLIGETAGPIIRAVDIPPDWRAEALGSLPPPWAGLTWDRPAVMGVLNVTPDSFSDGGRHADPGRAIAAGLAMAAEGADIVDVGGESTRPGAAAISPAEEQMRVVPVIRTLAGAGIRVSVDTRNAATMAAALDAGAAIVNDVSALTHDPAAARLVAARDACVVLMHMRGDPATMNHFARYDDVAVEVARELAIRTETALRAGIAQHNIVIDPGIGFAKTAAHNLKLMNRLPVLMNLGCPILVGASRKSFIGKVSLVEDPMKRLPGSLAAALFAAERGASILRVHDVAETVQALRVCVALG